MIKPKPDTKGDDLDSLIHRTGLQPQDQPPAPPASPADEAQKRDPDIAPEPQRASVAKKSAAALKPNKSFIISIPYAEWDLARRCAGMLGITLHDYILGALEQRNAIDGKPLKKLL